MPHRGISDHTEDQQSDGGRTGEAVNDPDH